jgi:dTDP-4-amino-4,6-dideoxygalactose transaminase
MIEKIHGPSSVVPESILNSVSVARDRIYLSSPHIGETEFEFVREAFDTNWIAPVGPHVDAFEREFAHAVGADHAVAVTSGTAALHLALRLAGVGEGDDVLVSTLTFCASVNPIIYLGARPVFIDSETASWNLDPNLLKDELRRRAATNRLPRALVLVHLYGQCADIEPVVALCRDYGVELIEDAAEALGARYWGWENGESGERGESLESGESGENGESGEKGEKGESGKNGENGESGEKGEKGERGRRGSTFLPSSHRRILPSSNNPVAQSPARSPGIFGRTGIFSFNGNKIITTSGGGMLVTDDGDLARHAKKLATQARDDAPHYEHSEIGYNYRMSNVLAGIGRGQLRVLDDRVRARRANFDWYVGALGDLPGISFMPEAPWGLHTRWLTCLTIDPAAFGASREDVRHALEAENIEARPVWKPMHLQPAYRAYPAAGGRVAEYLFEHGLCLPSGSNLSPQDLERVRDVIVGVCTEITR